MLQASRETERKRDKANTLLDRLIYRCLLEKLKINYSMVYDVHKFPLNVAGQWRDREKER